MDRSPPGSSVHAILQARIMEWVAMPSSRGSPDPGIESTSLMSPEMAGRFYTTSSTWAAPKDFLITFKTSAPLIIIET